MDDLISLFCYSIVIPPPIKITLTLPIFEIGKKGKKEIKWVEISYFPENHRFDSLSDIT